MKLRFEVIERPGAFACICTPIDSVVLMGTGEKRADAERRCAEQVAKWLNFAPSEGQAGTSMGIRAMAELRQGIVFESVMLSGLQPNLVALDS